MRAQAIEKLGKLICDEVGRIHGEIVHVPVPDSRRLMSLCVKFRILTDRDANPASVIREVMNDDC